jgi:hypothetical protein
MTVTRSLLLGGVLLATGAALVLAELRWFRRPSLADRLLPYGPGGLARPRRRGPLSADSFREVVGPLARTVGEALARIAGVGEELAVRLERLHSPLDVTAFRVRQLGWSLAAFAGAVVVVAGLQPPPGIALLFLGGGPALAFLLVEQGLARASAAWQERVVLELPVVAEQLAMLLGAGYSLGGALNRVARRGKGVCARDLARVCGRVRQGLSETEALREWAAVARVDALDRLVAVLAFNQEASDLGRLVTEEARAGRRDGHRRLLETVERRAQQVWVPVTVAALVPGVLFLAIPFIEALRVFSGP